jgi:uncharacterized membrane protein
VSDRPTSGPAPRYGEYAPIPEKIEAPAPQPVDEKPAAPEGAVAAKPQRAWDRALTIGLLAVGAVNLFFSIPQFANFGDSLREVFTQNGFGTYTSDGLATVLGAVAIVVQLVILSFSVFFARRNLAAGRVSFWIPLVGAVLSLIVVTAVVLGAMLPDPALRAWFDAQMSAAVASQPTPTATP